MRRRVHSTKSSSEPRHVCRTGRNVGKFFGTIKSHTAAVHQHQHSDAHLCTALRQSRIHKNALMNSSLGNDAVCLRVPSHLLLLQAGLSAVASIHEATAAACCPPGDPLLCTLCSSGAAFRAPGCVAPAAVPPVT